MKGERETVKKEKQDMLEARGHQLLLSEWPRLVLPSWGGDKVQRSTLTSGSAFLPGIDCSASSITCSVKIFRDS